MNFDKNLSEDRCTHTYASCAHQSSPKFLWEFTSIIWTQVKNLIKIQTFIAKIFAKQYCKKNHQFSRFSHIFTVFHLQRLQRWIIWEDDLLWKMTIIGRRPWVEDDLWWKTTNGRRQPSTEGNLQLKTTFGGRRPLVEEHHNWA